MPSMPRSSNASSSEADSIPTNVELATGVESDAEVVDNAEMVDRLRTRELGVLPRSRALSPLTLLILTRTMAVELVFRLFTAAVQEWRILDALECVIVVVYSGRKQINVDIIDITSKHRELNVLTG